MNIDKLATMKSKILLFLISLLLAIPALAQNQGEPIGLGGGGTKIFCRSNVAGTATSDAAGDANYISCDDSGRILLTPTSNAAATYLIVADTAETLSTASVLVVTAHVARVGDILTFTGGTAGNIGVSTYVTAVATNSITILPALPATPANGDAFNITRPAPFFMVQEDTPVQSGMFMYPMAARVRGDFNASAGDGDNGHINVDLDGRLAVNPWGADPTESGSSCGTATASTADVAMKAAFASNRIYVGSITCSSSDADNSTNINFKDGTTVMAVGGVGQMATTSNGAYSATFNPPLRGTVNTALNFNTAVSTSSVVCCAQWFTSGN